MNNYKICVYAICKNESKFAKRWYDSMCEADYVCVLDTGSDDNSVEILKNLGVCVESKTICPWRFDVARNESMKLIPPDTDICVCTDIDECFEAGWANKLRNAWNDRIKRVKYTYIWSIDEKGRPLISFMADKIHSYGDFKWTHPVHEVLEYVGCGEYSTSNESDVVLYHKPDNEKSREQYLHLLELSVEEVPYDDRNTHYLGREYMFRGMYDKSISMLKRHLSLKTAVWKDERCASMRYIARCYRSKNEYAKALNWYYRSIAEAPYLREPYVELAGFLLSRNEFFGAVYFANEALKIKTFTQNYITEKSVWTYEPYDILSVAYYYLGDYERAYKNAEIAVSYLPDNERLKNNKSVISAKIKTI